MKTIYDDIFICSESVIAVCSGEKWGYIDVVVGENHKYINGDGKIVFEWTIKF